MQVRKHQLELHMELQTGCKFGKWYFKVVYFHPAYLTYVQNTACKMLGWINSQSGIKRAGENINNPGYADDITFMAETEEETNSLLMKGKEEGEEADLQLNIQKTKIMASCSSFHCKKMGKQWKP